MVQSGETEAMVVDSIPSAQEAAPAHPQGQTTPVIPVGDGSTAASASASASGSYSTSVPAAPHEQQQCTRPPGPKRRRGIDDGPKEPLSEVVLRRLTKIKEGDSVLLRLPSDAIKSVTAHKDGLIHLGKYGSFPSSQLLGLHYDITYEIIAGPSTSTSAPTSTGAGQDQAQILPGSGASTPIAPGEESVSQNKKGKGKNKDQGGVSAANQLAWRNVLRPLRRQPIVDAVIDDITETNEFIIDLAEREKTTMSAEEINALRAEGLSAEEIIQRQIKAHEKFGLKTEFSKEKWRRRKEKKFYQTVHPLSPSIPNILSHYTERSPASILHLRADTHAQLLNMANIRPGSRYLVVDDTGGLVTASIIERMGAEGRVLLFTDSDSPPAWGILQTMNLSERELECVKWLNWMEADEDYQRPPPPPEDENVKPAKAAQRLRKHNAQVAELNATRDELHAGGWDGLILATTLSPISILSRLTRYLLGSTPIVVYSPYMQVLAELLNWSKRDPNYLHDTLSESWERTYQVLPGRTHPMMNTSATGGYIWSAIRVHPTKFQPDSHQRFKRRKTGKTEGKEAISGAGAGAEPTGEANSEDEGEDDEGQEYDDEPEAGAEEQEDEEVEEEIGNA
ncbi:tRNA (adenine-N(1)-)-methyltransferase non-catalytic subunit TRM6 [Kwoniella heveanensis CBS 569]|nr:tRNA (adenine-N(1)-)-methyltransferase non-catalytic subunit TRM6 [Kwoniella heveanensis CBS 569]